MELVNEFAAVEVEVDHRANGPRLRVRDLHSGRECFFDPTELMALTRMRHDDLKPFVDPAFPGRA